VNEPDAISAKRELRAQVRERRAARGVEDRADAQRGLNAQIGSLLAAGNAKRIAAFIPTETEPPITHILEKASLAGVEILLPISRPDRSMDWAPHPVGTPFEADHLGMPAPVGAIVDPALLQTVDLVLCPAALVDSKGYRLGWGLGYYDRFLNSLAHQPPVLAVVFDDEVVDALPHESHDHPVSGAITPSRTIWF